MREYCPECNRDVEIGKDGRRVTHGPASDGAFICPGSGDKSMVEAAKHIKVSDARQSAINEIGDD